MTDLLTQVQNLWKTDENNENKDDNENENNHPVNFTLHNSNRGWRIVVHRDWEKWVEHKLATDFEYFPTLEESLQDFLDYVKEHNVMV